MLNLNANQIRIYVACLSAYNNGKLHGAWIDLPADVEDVEEQIQAMLAASPEPGAEEWAIHDFEGFEGVRVDEHSDLERLCALAECLEEVSDREAFGLWVANGCTEGLEIEEWAEKFGEEYCGTFKNIGDYAFQMEEEAGNKAPEWCARFIDWEQMEEEWRHAGEIWRAPASGMMFHVFTCRVHLSC